MYKIQFYSHTILRSFITLTPGVNIIKRHKIVKRPFPRKMGKQSSGPASEKYERPFFRDMCLKPMQVFNSNFRVELSLSFDIKLKIENDFEFEFELKLKI